MCLFSTCQLTNLLIEYYIICFESMLYLFIVTVLIKGGLNICPLLTNINCYCKFIVHYLSPLKVNLPVIIISDLG